MTDLFSLHGKTALVTGGNQGLGAAFALALLEAGAQVAICGRDESRNEEFVAKCQAQGHAVHSVTADITNEDQLAEMVADVVAAFGRIDILVNNAGRSIWNPALEVTHSEWAEVFDLNVRALFTTSVAVAEGMRARGGGSIVNIGSMSGIIVNRPQLQAPYNTSKAAVHHLTRSLAVEWAPYGIRVNAVAPGYVNSENTPVDDPELRHYWIDEVPQRRYAEPEEIAPCVVFLASDAASFITGSVLVADGGYVLV
ncbi:SDR family NAD(P)-dependent oxidoreductase [Herbiconiux sp. UC225_62]|uniref:SDR family NAD(P)-dependent oxidoreductase n=1 Tax=Herbiconiux sp. UC225_62 TaxID=3350168 RepID=UPI0036D26575